MNCLLVPTLAVDLALLTRLAKSIDYPIPCKVIVNNGEPGALREWQKMWPAWAVYEEGRNLGVAGAWNLAPRLFVGHNGWLITNDDQEFQPGVLKAICKATDARPADTPIVYVNEHRAYDVFVWTLAGVLDFGFFDENFWPAYYEDYEMRCRFEVKSKPRPLVIKDKLEFKHGKPYPAGPEYTKMLASVGPINHDYLMRKWGGETPKYATPFNQNCPVQQWSLDLHGRRQREALFNKWWSIPNRTVQT